MLERCLANLLPVAQVVGGVGEARLAVVAALDHVLRYAGKVEGGCSSGNAHGVAKRGHAGGNGGSDVGNRTHG